ncbi:hypothetical protein NDA18_006487 [Ustilago nuda]|nr:hypothetical protein NDA18_006487 [Ustilago nuda]
MSNARSWPIAIAGKRVQVPSRIVSPPLNTPRYRTIRRLTSLDPDRDIPLALQHLYLAAAAQPSIHRSAGHPRFRSAQLAV